MTHRGLLPFSDVSVCQFEICGGKRTRYSLCSVAQVDGEATVVWPPKQHAVPRIAEREANQLNSWAHAVGDDDLISRHRIDWLEMLVHEPGDGIPKAMRARESIAICQRVAIDAELVQRSI